MATKASLVAFCFVQPFMEAAYKNALLPITSAKREIGDRNLQANDWQSLLAPPSPFVVATFRAFDASSRALGV
jgi:hypothetical protein